MHLKEVHPSSEQDQTSLRDFVSASWLSMSESISWDLANYFIQILLKSDSAEIYDNYSRSVIFRCQLVQRNIMFLWLNRILRTENLVLVHVPGRHCCVILNVFVKMPRLLCLFIFVIFCFTLTLQKSKHWRHVTGWEMLASHSMLRCTKVGSDIFTPPLGG